MSIYRRDSTSEILLVAAYLIANGGEEEIHTGGHTLYISPGVRVGISHTWSLYTSFGIPIINDLNGVQSEPDYRIFAGISKSFL